MSVPRDSRYSHRFPALKWTAIHWRVTPTKTSLIWPLWQRRQAIVPKLRAAALGPHTGGTLDKLENPPAFSTNYCPDEFRTRSARVGRCFIGQRAERSLPPMASCSAARRNPTVKYDPADRSFDHVERRLTIGSDALVLDVKGRRGAFIKAGGRPPGWTDDGRHRAAAWKGASQALITDMSHSRSGITLGANAVEVWKPRRFSQRGSYDEGFFARVAARMILSLPSWFPTLDDARELA